MSKEDLTDQQRRFADGVLAGKSQRQAYEDAGYKARGASADAKAARLVRNGKVAAYLARKREKLAEKTEITAERVLREYARIAFADIRDLFTWDEERACYVPSRDLTDEQAAAVSAVEAETRRFTNEDGETETTIKLKLKTYDKKGALDSIAKHLGMFVERHEHSGPGGGPIETRDLTDAELLERARAQAGRLAALATNGNGNGRK